MTCSRPQQTVPQPCLEPGTPWSIVRDAHHWASPPHFYRTPVVSIPLNLLQHLMSSLPPLMPLVIHQVLSQCTFSEYTHTHTNTHARTQHFLHFHICVREGSVQPVHPSDHQVLSQCTFSEYTHTQTRTHAHNISYIFTFASEKAQFSLCIRLVRIFTGHIKKLHDP